MMDKIAEAKLITEDTFTVVVVSDDDFKAHLNGNELINDTSYPKWRRTHHECTFKALSNEYLDQQMRKVLLKHE